MYRKFLCLKKFRAKDNDYDDNRKCNPSKFMKVNPKNNSRQDVFFEITLLDCYLKKIEKKLKLHSFAKSFLPSEFRIIKK